MAILNLEAYTKKYVDSHEKAKQVVDQFVKRCGMPEEELKAAFLGNSLDFHNQCIAMAKLIAKGRVFCTTYAGCVAAFAEYFGVEYKVSAGCALPKDAAGYEKNREVMTKNPDKAVCNHVWVDVGSNRYQLFTTYISNIEIFAEERIA